MSIKTVQSVEFHFGKISNAQEGDCDQYFHVKKAKNLK